MGKGAPGIVTPPGGCGIDSGVRPAQTLGIDLPRRPCCNDRRYPQPLTPIRPGIFMPFTRLVRRQLIVHAAATGAFALAAFAPVPAFSQAAAQWPERPVKLLVTVGAGGAADTLSRNLASGFAQFANNQPLVVENRPGAGGTIAAAAVAREKPDGYTLFLTEVGPNAVSHTLTAKLPYDPHTAFTPIIHAANLPAVVLIRPTLLYTTLADFVSAAKQRPG